MLKDEYSMLAGSLNHAGFLLATYAREAKFRLRRENYAMPGERYGRMPLLGDFGDHLQLPPAPKNNSMLTPLASRRSSHLTASALCLSFAADDAL